jgi:stage V sporulation protein G
VEITEVRIKLMENRRDKLQAFCSITLDDDFVIRDLKIIEGARGAFVAMPSRKLTDRCPRCGGKNHLRAAFCNDCGAALAPNRAGKDLRGRARLHADVAHPVHAGCRERLQNKILEEFRRELGRSQQPGYVPQELHPLPDFGEEEQDAFEHAPRPVHSRYARDSRISRRFAPGPEKPAPAAGAD